MENKIEIHDVTKSFHGGCILKNINLTIPTGSTVGIVGANGSGKSVLFKLICGFVKPDQGEVIVNGEVLGSKNDFPQNVGVFINEPGYISIYNGFQNLRYLADIKGIISDSQICDTMKLVGLDPKNKTKVENYSLGMKQKLGIAQAIMEDQEIVILDEPFNALDYKTHQDIKEIIRILQSEEKTVLLTSHNYEDIEELCDYIYLIEDGVLEELSGLALDRYRNCKR
ncbi:ABC transporter, ATP-binding protein [Lachnospiraceae bacterium KM106-2]|nr:ABC transporter, ATP-binding protein [Lachnospiraceae bacterium KM106-2]